MYNCKITYEYLMLGKIVYILERYLHGIGRGSQGYWLTRKEDK